jgi:hypothetical protein
LCLAKLHHREQLPAVIERSPLGKVEAVVAVLFSMEYWPKLPSEMRETLLLSVVAEQRKIIIQQQQLLDSHRVSQKRPVSPSEQFTAKQMKR